MAQDDSDISRYSPLNEGEFRLIKFTATEDFQINVEIEHFVLETETRWKALSYRWGEEETTELIHLGDTHFLVKPNLFAFIKCMIREQQSDWFFVDAICINQSDLLERASQVKLMGEIYRRAIEVIAWIRLTDTPGSAETIETLESIEAVERNPVASQRTKEAASHIRETLKHSEAVWELLHNKFWSRLWIVQEVLLARRVIIHCGYYARDAADFFALWQSTAAAPMQQGGSYVLSTS